MKLEAWQEIVHQFWIFYHCITSRLLLWLVLLVTLSYRCVSLYHGNLRSPRKLVVQCHHAVTLDLFFRLLISFYSMKDEMKCTTFRLPWLFYLAHVLRIMARKSNQASLKVVSSAWRNLIKKQSLVFQSYSVKTCSLSYLNWITQ